MSNLNEVQKSPHYHILNLEPNGYCEEARTVLRGLGDVTEGPLSRQELIEQLSDYDILIVRLGHQIDREVLGASNRLKAIVSATTGLDHIDLQAAEAGQIAVLSLRGEKVFLRTITATAEHTWALLLALMRRIPEAVGAVRVGQWDRDRFKGCTLAGKRLGILGLGRVGRQVARYGTAFGMRVAAYDTNPNGWPPAVARRDSVKELLTETDVLCIHVNLYPGTVKLVGRAELAALPQGAIVINTSRGEVIDEEALRDALVSGHLHGAAVDVLTGERMAEQRRGSHLIAYAREHHNLLITPHVAGATHEAMKKTELFMAHKLARFLRSMPV